MVAVGASVLAMQHFQGAGFVGPASAQNSEAPAQAPKPLTHAAAPKPVKAVPKAAPAPAKKAVAPAPAAAAAAAPEHTASISADPSPFVAVEQAKAAGAACIPALSDLSKITVDTKHTAVSTWSKEAPDKRSFVSLDFLDYENQPTAPRALVFMTVAPTQNKRCDANNVRVQPSKLSCEEISANLAKQNAPAPQAMNDTLLYQPNQTGQRIVLMPTATTGCVVISTGSYYGP